MSSETDKSTSVLHTVRDHGDAQIYSGDHYYTSLTNKICKQCSFECDMGKYSTMNKIGEHHIHWTCAVFLHSTQKMNIVCISNTIN